MGKLILARHGETDANRERRFAESGDVPINDLGREQALALALKIGERFEPSLVLSSAFLRARQTALIIARHLGLESRVVTGLHERDYGTYKGASYDSPPEQLKRHPLWRPEGGESRDDVRLRVVPVLDDLRQQYPDDQLVLISHGIVMVAIWAHLTGDWNNAHVPPNCGIIEVDYDDAGFGLPTLIP